MSLCVKDEALISKDANQGGDPIQKGIPSDDPKSISCFLGSHPAFVGSEAYLMIVA